MVIKHSGAPMPEYAVERVSVSIAEARASSSSSPSVDAISASASDAHSRESWRSLHTRRSCLT
eukprot:1431582-Pyramimonas_sp.AAC.1